MNKIYAAFILMVFSISVYAAEHKNVSAQDTMEVINMTKSAYAVRFTSSEETVKSATKALELAKKLDYPNGIAEAYRVKGIGEYYSSKYEDAIEDYLNAISTFQSLHNVIGEARVYNNLGNLYQEIDYDKALNYFNKAKAIIESLKAPDKSLKASLYLNMGNVYYRKKSFYLALSYYSKSNELFQKLNNPVLLVQCLQNLGVINYNLKNYDTAKVQLTQANERAKQLDLNNIVASIDLTLTSLYTTLNEFDKAEKYRNEGVGFAQIINSDKLLYDYQFDSFELEFKRKNYERALGYLRTIYKQDSIKYKTRTFLALNLSQIKYDQEKKQQESRIIIERQKGDRILFWGATIVAGLFLVVIGLLISNVKRKTATNKKLQELNDEVLKQKDDLDRINHHLEDIIDDRTKDLLNKNKKLSEYSSYLSHQIRGPIATLKGLMNLEKEGLVGMQECINMMDKCVSEIDEKIIDMSDMLHDPERTDFK